MLLLGIDTSGKTASVSVYDTTKELFLAQTSIYTKMTHSQVILPLCKEVLAKSQLTLEDIDEIAVAVGPGSYTGLRIGISAVKALCFGLDRKCDGVSTLLAMAYNNISHKGNICAIMSARNDLVYTALFRSDGYSIECIEEEKIVSHSELAEILAFSGSETLLCGDGCMDFFMKYQSPLLILASPHLRLQNASGVCLAATCMEAISPSELEAKYLQKVKAEKDLEEKNNSK